MLMKLCHQVSFDILAALFCLSKKQTASNIFYKHIVYQWRTNCNIPTILKADHTVNQNEVNKLFDDAYDRTYTENSLRTSKIHPDEIEHLFLLILMGLT